MPNKDRSNKDPSVEIHNDIDWPRCGDKLGGFSLVRPILSHAHGRREFVASYMDTIVRLMIEAQSSGIDIATEMQIRSFIDCDFIAKASELFTYDNHYHIFTIAVFDDIFSSNFSNFLQNKRIQAGSAVTLLAPMAEALLMTHRKGIAHTQITQDNMYISTQGKPYLEGFNNCLILNAGDFGLVEQSKNITGDKQIRTQKAKDLSSFAQFAKTVLVNQIHSKKINDYLELSIDQMINAHHTQLSEIALEEALERFIDAIFEWQSASSIFQQEFNEPITKQISPLGSEAFFKQAHLDTKSNLLNFESAHLRADRHTQKSEKTSALQEIGTKIKSITQSVRPGYWIFLGVCVTVFITFAFMLFLKPSESTANPGGQQQHSVRSAKVADSTAYSTVVAQETAHSSIELQVPAKSAPLPEIEALIAKRDECLASGNVECILGVYAKDSASANMDIEKILDGGANVRQIGRKQWNAVAMPDIPDMRAYTAKDGSAFVVCVLKDEKLFIWDIRVKRAA